MEVGWMWWGGVGYSHGDVVTITGSGFGTHSLGIEFLGGSTGHLETAPIGTDTSFGSWTLDGTVPKTITSDATRGKCWRINANGVSGTLDGSARYDYGADIGEGEKVYLAWYVKASLNDTVGQWKMLRISDINDITDHGSEIVLFNWRGGSGSQCIIRPNSDASGTTYYGNAYPDFIGTWCLMEVILTTSSQGVANGVYKMSRRTPGAAGYTASQLTYSGGDLNQDAALIYNAADRFRWFIWQNYLGNGFDGADSPLEIWMDDVYVQVGSHKRVLLADNASLASATLVEIQQPTAWSDTSVQFRLNAGGLSPGAYYAHVVDNVNTSLGSKLIEVA